MSITCYPGGNFGGNQLLDGSIGLSPLCSNSAINLHVRTATVFQPRFLWPSTFPSIVHHLSGLRFLTLSAEGWCIIDIAVLGTPTPWSVFQDGLVDSLHHMTYSSSATTSFLTISWSDFTSPTAVLFTFPSRYFYAITFW